MKKVLLLFMALMFSMLTWSQTYLTESFEGAWSGTPAAPSGWSIQHTTATGGSSGTDPIYWSQNTWSGSAWSISPYGGSPTTPTGAYDLASVAWYKDGSAKATQKDQISTGNVDLSASTNPRVTFYLAISASSSLTLKLRGSNDGGATWADIQTITKPGVAWTKVAVTIPIAYKVANAQFGIEVTASWGSYDVFFDKFVIEESPTPFSGIYSINNTLPTTTTLQHDGSDNFASFTDAITALNDAGVSGAVTFNVTAGQTFAENTPIITATGTVANTITFVKSGAGANPVITPTGTAGSTDAGITIAGGDYITFDGIDINASAVTAVEYGYFVRNASATDGAQYNVVKNCAVTLNRTNTSSRAIYQNVSSTPTNATGANSYNKYQNIQVSNTYSGIWLAGNATYNDLMTEISNCTIGAASANDIGFGSSSMNGIRITSGADINIFNNEIRNMTVTGGASLYGLYVESLKGTANNIYNNKIHDLTSTSTSTSAVIYALRTDINSSMVCNVYNNMIFGLQHAISTPTTSYLIRGISVGVSGTGIGNFYYNSVRIDEDANPSSQCFYINGGTANLKNNVFANFSTAGATSKRYCIYRGAGTLTNVDYNDYYIAAGTNSFIGYFTADQATLANWQTASSKDANSLSVDPMFAGTSNLHSTSSDLNAAGVTISIANGDALDITTDIDGDLRNVTTPDMGADEFDPPTCAVPTALTATNLNYTTATISWTAPAGTPVGYEYEVRTSGAAGSGATGLVVSGTTVDPIVTADITGLTGATTYTYYVRTDCGAGDFSPWTSGTFNTLSCNVPTGVVASAITTTTATITWVAPVVGSPDGYEYEVRSSGAAGSGATGLAASGTTLAPIVTDNISGLTEATTYSIYVRTNCSVGFYSAWTSAVVFTTECNPEIAPTAVQTFATFTGAAPQPVCWKEATGTLAPTTTLTGTTSKWTNATGFANTGTNVAVKTNLYGTYNDWLISNAIDLGATPGEYRLSYRYAVTSYNGTTAQATLGTHKVSIVISTDGGTTWSDANIIKQYTGAGTYSNTGVTETINLTGYSGVVKFALVQTTSSTTPDIDFHFDDFVIEAMPACVEPSALVSSAITSNSATISWTASASAPANGYDYYVATTTTAPDGATVPTGSVAAGVTTADLSSLSASTTYYFWVRSNCNGVDYSAWTSFGTFTTSDNFLTLPISEDFESGLGVVHLVNGTQVNYWMNGPLASQTGDCMYITNNGVANAYSTGSTSTSHAYIPVDFNGITNATLSFDWISDGENSFDFLKVYLVPESTVITAGTQLSAADQIGTIYQDGTAIQTPVITLSASEISQDLMKLVFSWRNDGSGGTQPPASVDNILLEEITCMEPTTIAAGNITSTSADITWTASVLGETSWNIKVNATNTIDPTTTDGDIVTNAAVSTTPEYALSTLSPETDYYVYIQSACGSDWVEYMFTTPAACPVPTGLSSLVTGSSTATLSWDELGETAWNIKISLTQLADPGSVTADIEDAITGGTGEYLATGLTGNTTYYWYVQSDCGSDWSAEGMFTTDCGVYTLNVVEGFNAATIPACWSKAFISPQTGTKITFVTTGSYPTTSPQEGSHMVLYNSYSNTNGGAGSEERLISPPIATTGTSSVDLEFYWRNENYSYYSSGAYLNEGVQVQYSTDGSTWTDAGSLYPRHDGSLASGTAQWNKKTLTLPAGAANQATVYIAFKFHSEWGDNMFLDNITLKPTPTCIVPTDLAAAAVTSSTATVSWTASPSNPGNGYQYYLATTSTPAPDGATVPTGSTAAGVVSVDLTSLTESTNYYIWVRSNCDGVDFSEWTDPLNFTTIASCLEPTALTSTNITTSSATISWTASASSPANGYEYFVATTSTPVPDGTTVPTGATAAGITSVDISSLSPSTQYYVWVRSNCNGVDFSLWAGPVSFATECASVTSFVENFESTTASNFPICWAKVGATGGAYPQASTGISGARNLYMYDGATVRMRPVSNAGAGTHQLRFKQRANWTTGETVYVGYLTNPDDDASFVSITSFVTTSLTASEMTLNLGTAAGTNEVLAFQAGTTGYSFLIDDIYWEPIPTCLAPSDLSVANITTTGATVSWTENGSALQWNLKASTTPFDPETEPGMFPPISSGTNPFVIPSGLTPGTTYYWAVQADCGGGDVSAWVSGMFTTECVAFTIPFAQDFSSVTTGEIPACWAQTSQNYFEVAATNLAGGSAPEMVMPYVATVTADIKLFSPTIDATANPNINLSFKQYVDWYTASFNLRVDYTTDNGTTWLPLWTRNVTGNVAAEEVSIDISSYVGGEEFQLAWVFSGNTWNIDAWNIDDVLIDVIPEIDIVDINSDVADISVCQGTTEAAAIADLATQITITDTDAGEHVVNLTWTIASYDANTPDDYTATGTFTLPAGVAQSSPVTPLEVTAIVTVTAPVIPEFSFNTTYCVGSIGDALPTTSDNGYTGTWDIAAINTSAAGNTNYTFTPDGGQCASNVVIPVTVNDPIAPSFSFETTYCVAATADALPTTSDDGYTGTWDIATISTAAAGSTDYTFTPDAGQCAIAAVIAVTVNDPVAPTFSFDTEYCVGDVADILPITSDNGFTGTWVDATINTAVSGSTDYTFTPDAGECATPATISVTVNDLPVVTCPANFEVTTSDIVVLSGAAPIGGEYTGTNVTLGEFDPYGLANGPYTITYTYTDIATGCSSFCDFVITVNIAWPEIDIIDVNNDVADIAVCAGTIEADAIALLANEITISDADANEHLVPVIWTIASYDGNTAGDYNATGTFTLPFNVSQTDPATTLEVSAVVTVNANLVPTFTFETTYCEGETADILPLTSDNGVTGTWAPAAIDTNIEGATDYTFTPDGAICATPVTISVTVNPTLTPTFSFATTYCIGATADALPLTSDNGVTGTWDIATISTATAGSTDYTFTPDAGQCAIATVVAVTVNDEIIPTFSFATEYCFGETADLLPLTSDNGITGSWMPAVINTATSGNTDYTFTEDAGQCAAGSVVPVTVNDLPVVTCPDNMAIASNAGVTTLTGASPAGGVYSGTNVTGDQFDPTGLPLGAYTITYTYTDPTTGCVNSCDFVIDVVVNIINTEVASIAIYPNPNNGIFTLNFSNVNGEVNYQIYDTKGSIIVDEDIMTSGNTVKEVELNLVPGVYYVKLITNAQTVVEKLVIE